MMPESLPEHPHLAVPACATPRWVSPQKSPTRVRALAAPLCAAWLLGLTGLSSAAQAAQPWTAPEMTATNATREPSEDLITANPSQSDLAAGDPVQDFEPPGRPLAQAADGHGGDEDEEQDGSTPQSIPQAGAGAHAESEGPLPNVALTREILFQVLAAEIAVQRDQVGPAITTYLSLAKNVRDPRFARRATELALAERSLEQALQAAQIWYALAPGSVAAAQTVEALWLATDRLGEAEPLLAARLARARADGTLPTVYTQLGRALARASDKALALAMLERLSQPDEEVPEARLALASVAASAGQLQRAAAEAGQALRLRPKDARIAIQAAQYTQATELGNDGAAAILASFLQQEPDATEARFAYARLLAAQGHTEQAREQMQQALAQRPDNPSILFSLAQLAYEMKQTAQAEQYLKKLVELPRSVSRDDVPAFLFLAQIAEENKRYEEAIQWLSKVRRGEQRIPAMVHRALLMGRLKQIDQARALLQGASVTSPRERAQLISGEAQLLREAQRYTQAFEVIDAALEKSPADADLLYDHAMAAEKLDRLPVMEASLRKLMKLRPQYAHAYNALGYTFAERNIRLDEAKALIEQALALSPDDVNIVDSMGWVLYRQGDLQQALTWLRRAYSIRPEPDVAAHLGEVLWKSGQTADAREMWSQARKRDPDNETLKETLARLNVAL
jgi:tetratricopeptide (TPR) repeat protein